MFKTEDKDHLMGAQNTALFLTDTYSSGNTANS